MRRLQHRNTSTQAHTHWVQMPKYVSALGCTYSMMHFSIKSKSPYHYTTVAIKISCSLGRMLMPWKFQACRAVENNSSEKQKPMAFIAPLCFQNKVVLPQRREYCWYFHLQGGLSVSIYVFCSSRCARSPLCHLKNTNALPSPIHHRHRVSKKKKKRNFSS